MQMVMERKIGTAIRRLMGGLRGEEMHTPSMIMYASMLDVFYLIFINQRDECECLALVLPRVYSYLSLHFPFFILFFCFCCGGSSSGLEMKILPSALT